MSSHVRGEGSVYRRGRLWWVKYHVRGTQYCESSGSEDEMVARKMLRNRLAEASRGRGVLRVTAEKITLADMADALLTDYRLNGNRSSPEAHIGKLAAYFGDGERAVDITADKVAKYVEHRMEQRVMRKGELVPPSNASINREMACLRRMFRVMVEKKRLSHDDVPKVPHLEEAEPRQGFLEPAEFAALREALPEHLRGAISFAYLTGWRKGAVRSLEWANNTKLRFSRDGQVSGGFVILKRAKSKNKRPVTVAVAGALLGVMSDAWRRRIPECPYVFHHDGAPIGDFRKAWRAACREAGLDGLLIHDLRRSAVRNLTNAGNSDVAAMAVTGHRTRSVFDRYNIVSDADRAAAMERQSAYIDARIKDGPKVVPIHPRAA